MVRALLCLILSITVSFSAYYLGANVGHDIGYTSGYTQAILDDKTIIECHFQCRPGKTRQTP